MSDISTFKFDKESFSEIKKFQFGTNWPVVYLLKNEKEIYIGESTNLHSRSKQHFEKEERRRLKDMHVITDFEYNKSAALDIESMLIEHVVADEKYVVQNGNKGISNHDYFERDKYRGKFEVIWKKLMDMSIVQKSLLHIRNSQIFKYSPFKALTEDQINIVEKIKKILRAEKTKTILVEGGPGTGKTILATYMVKNFLEHKDLSKLKIGLVIPMVPLRKTLKKVFTHVKGLKAGMVLGPNDVANGQYDLLIIDEAHRLRQRRNHTNMKAFDDINKSLGLEKDGNEIDWILASSKYQIFFYDKNQSVRPADIDQGRFEKMDAVRMKLEKQKRVKGGEKYIQFIQNTLDMEPSECNFEEYEFQIFDNISEMVSAVKEKNKEYGLCRVVAGYAWPWKTRHGAGHDIEIDGLKLSWNSETNDWVNSENALNEVGCIHTIQGYDLNYAGVIIGPEISYDDKTHKIIVDKDKYKDINGKKSISNPEELKFYILNIYKTLLTRGIYGTYVYVVDEKLREYLKAAADDTDFT